MKHIICNLRPVANLSEMSNFDFCLVGGGGLFYETREHPNATMRHLDCVSYACRCWHNVECWPDSFVAFSGDPGQYC